MGVRRGVKAVLRRNLHFDVYGPALHLTVTHAASQLGDGPAELWLNQQMAYDFR